jgi:hypothetical protein
MNTRTKLISACASLLLAVTASAPSASAAVNLLVDPGFEANPLTTASNVLNFFTTYQGQWGPEAATIVTGTNDSVTPLQGVNMLAMTDDGQTATQCFQATDVSSYAALINSGNATINMSASFDANLPAAIGAVYVSFFTGSNYGTLTSTIGNSLALDSAPGTWQPISVGGAIPVGTTWVVSQVVYNDASLYSSAGVVPSAGYVDAAALTIDSKNVPEPATIIIWSLLGACAVAVSRRHRKAA